MQTEGLLGLHPRVAHISSPSKGDHWYEDYPGQRFPEGCGRNSHSGTGSKTPLHPTHRVCTHVQAFSTGVSVYL